MRRKVREVALRGGNAFLVRRPVGLEVIRDQRELTEAEQRNLRGVYPGEQPGDTLDFNRDWDRVEAASWLIRFEEGKRE